jgi:hypothetical protein
MGARSSSEPRGHEPRGTSWLRMADVPGKVLHAEEHYLEFTDKP